MSGFAQVNFRIPQELKEKLEQSAKESGRSITSELVTRLEQSFTQPQVKQANSFDTFMWGLEQLVPGLPVDNTSTMLATMVDTWKKSKKD